MRAGRADWEALSQADVLGRDSGSADASSTSSPAAGGGEGGGIGVEKHRAERLKGLATGMPTEHGAKMMLPNGQMVFGDDHLFHFGCLRVTRMHGTPGTIV